MKKIRILLIVRVVGLSLPTRPICVSSQWRPQPNVSKRENSTDLSASCLLSRLAFALAGDIDFYSDKKRMLSSLGIL